MAEMARKLARTREELADAAREHEETKTRLVQAEARAVRGYRLPLSPRLPAMRRHLPRLGLITSPPLAGRGERRVRVRPHCP